MNTAADTIKMPSGGNAFAPCRRARRGEADTEDGRWSRLMARAQAGDRSAYDRLLRAIQPYIRAIAGAQHRPDRVEDVVQEVLLTVHRMRHTYDPARPFRPWLAAIARRRSIDALRRRYRSARFELSVPAFDSAYAEIADPRMSGLDAAHAAADALGRAVTLLPRQQREAVELLR